ncbi:MAG: hypothetical protein BWY49_00209 [Candidatus Omnitrophica bacterium ADurb.Bin314]|nr:MAG: hypothetical protein BWY49_00209 [Candidatus Omnitrophica bacterium ADurb.Bin314]
MGTKNISKFLGEHNGVVLATDHISVNKERHHRTKNHFAGPILPAGCHGTPPPDIRRRLHIILAIDELHMFLAKNLNQRTVDLLIGDFCRFQALTLVLIITLNTELRMVGINHMDMLIRVIPEQRDQGTCERIIHFLGFSGIRVPDIHSHQRFSTLFIRRKPIHPRNGVLHIRERGIRYLTEMGLFNFTTMYLKPGQQASAERLVREIRLYRS